MAETNNSFWCIDAPDPDRVARLNDRAVNEAYVKRYADLKLDGHTCRLGEETEWYYETLDMGPLAMNCDHWEAVSNDLLPLVPIAFYVLFYPCFLKQFAAGNPAKEQSHTDDLWVFLEETARFNSVHAGIVRFWHEEAKYVLGRARSSWLDGVQKSTDYADATAALAKSGWRDLTADEVRALPWPWEGARKDYPRRHQGRPIVRGDGMDELDRSQAVALLERLVGRLGDPDRAERVRTLEQLHELCLRFGRLGAPATPSLINLLDEPDEEICSGALATLKTIGQPGPSPPPRQATTLLERLVSRLECPDGRTLEQLHDFCLVFGRLGASATDSLVKALDDPEEEIRCGALAVLGAIGEPVPGLAPRLVSWLRSPKESLQSCAAQALTTFRFDGHEDAVVPVLVEMLDDPRSAARGAIARALGSSQCRTAEVLNALVNAQSDEDGHLRAAAAAALTELGERG